MSKEELLAQGAANYKALLLPVRPEEFSRTAYYPMYDPASTPSSCLKVPMIHASSFAAPERSSLTYEQLNGASTRGPCTHVDHAVCLLQVDTAAIAAAGSDRTASVKLKQEAAAEEAAEEMLSMW